MFLFKNKKKIYKIRLFLQKKRIRKNLDSTGLVGPVLSNSGPVVVSPGKGSFLDKDFLSQQQKHHHEEFQVEGDWHFLLDFPKSK